MTFDTDVAARNAANESVVVQARIAADSEAATVMTNIANGLMARDNSYISGQTAHLKVNAAHQANQQRTNALELQGIALDGAQRTENDTTNSLPFLGQHMQQMQQDYREGNYEAIDNMVFDNVTPAHADQLDAERARLRKTEVMKDHAATQSAENDRNLAEETGLLAGWKNFAPKQRGLFEDTDSAGNKKYKNDDGTINEDGKDLAHRLTEWNRITEGMTPSAKGKIVTHLNPNPQLTGGLGIPAGPMNPNGETVKGVFIPSEEGLEAAEKAVLSAKATRTAAQITQAGDYGQVITGATLKDGKMEYTFARGMPTPSEFGKQVLAEVKDITDNAETLGLTDDDGVVDMPAVYREALKRSGMANTPFARNASDAVGLGVGDRYFNINNGRMEQINKEGASVPAGSDRSHLDTQAERDRIAARQKSDEAAAAAKLERGGLLKSFKPMVDADTKAKAKQKQMQAAAKAKVIADHKAATAAKAAKVLDLRREQLKLLNLVQKQRNEGSNASAKATTAKLNEISKQIKELEKKK
tara:strand:- start:8227 stop:9813 length:1587 start_codon:yes stop_codon:yes gene_type:complete